MNIKILYIALVLSGISISGFSQVTIEECYREAQNNYPLIKKCNLIDRALYYNLSNAGKGYLPDVRVSAKATYQSDVTMMPFDPAQLGFEHIIIPTLSKDQYSATVDVKQVLWDGGRISSDKENIKSSAQVDRYSTEVTVYNINETVNHLFFGILLSDAQISQNELYQSDLSDNFDNVKSYIENGVANQSDLDAVKIDQLNARQQLIQYKSVRNAYVSMLSQLTGKDYSESTVFEKPQVVLPSNMTINRIELRFYESQINNYMAQLKTLTAGIMPRIELFAKGGYGKPGLNMLKDQFSAYYVAGVMMTWNPCNFYTYKNSKRLIRNNISQIDVQRETFLFNTRLDVIQTDNIINSYYEQLSYDDEIIALRTSVRKASEVKMENGTISGTDLMRDVNAEQRAILDRIYHETELLQAIYDMKYVTNN